MSDLSKQDLLIDNLQHHLQVEEKPCSVRAMYNRDFSGHFLGILCCISKLNITFQGGNTEPVAAEIKVNLQMSTPGSALVDYFLKAQTSITPLWYMFH